MNNQKAKSKGRLKFTEADIKANREGLVTARQLRSVFRHSLSLILLASIASGILIGPTVLLLLMFPFELMMLVPLTLVIVFLGFIFLVLWVLLKDIFSDLYHQPVEVAVGYPDGSGDTAFSFGEQRVEFMHKEGKLLDKTKRYRVYYLMKCRLALSFELLDEGNADASQ